MNVQMCQRKSYHISIVAGSAATKYPLAGNVYFRCAEELLEGLNLTAEILYADESNLRRGGGVKIE